MTTSIKIVTVIILSLILPKCNRITIYSTLSIFDTLKIQVEMSECGEFGGHREHIYIYKNKDNNLYATYQRDTVQCGNRVSMFGVPSAQLRAVVFDTTVTFKRKYENEVNSFISRIFKLKLKGQIPIANYGDRYWISRTDSTFSIEYTNIANKKNTRFNSLKRKLFGDL